MIVIQIHPQSMTNDEISELKSKLTSFFLEKSTQSEIPIHSLLWQCYTGLNNGFFEADPLEILHGSLHIHEELKCLVGRPENPDVFKFRISPFAFFQSSTKACEELYRIIGEWVISDKNSNINQLDKEPSIEKKITLLDLCSGTVNTIF